MSPDRLPDRRKTHDLKWWIEVTVLATILAGSTVVVAGKWFTPAEVTANLKERILKTETRIEGIDKSLESIDKKIDKLIERGK